MQTINAIDRSACKSCTHLEACDPCVKAAVPQTLSLLKSKRLIRIAANPYPKQMSAPLGGFRNIGVEPAPQQLIAHCRRRRLRTQRSNLGRQFRPKGGRLRQELPGAVLYS